MLCLSGSQPHTTFGVWRSAMTARMPRPVTTVRTFGVTRPAQLHVYRRVLPQTSGSSERGQVDLPFALVVWPGATFVGVRSLRS